MAIKKADEEILTDAQRAALVALKKKWEDHHKETEAALKYAGDYLAKLQAERQT